jgi:hypothetical protein
MFLIIAAVILVLWLLGLIGHVGGSLINLLIVVALISIIIHFLRGRHTTV